MKTTKALFGTLIVTMALASQLSAQSSLTNGLVAFYPFNGNANDASGNGNHLTNFGAQLCSDRFGSPNQAYTFDGTNYLGRSGSPLTQVDNWTLSAWILPSSLRQTTAFAVCMGHDTGTAGNGYGLGISGGQGVEGGGGMAGSNVWAFFPGEGFISDQFGFSSTNQWHHIVMLRNSGTLMFYVDGNFVTNALPTLAPGQLLAAPTGFEVGSGGSTARFFDGAIDQVRVYNRPLSSAEVSQLYNYESAENCTNPAPATAVASVTNGFLISADVTSGGCGYSNAPIVQIVGGGGSGATAVAIATNGVVLGVTITDAGIGYLTAPTIVFSPPTGCVPHSASAALTVTNGFVVSVELTDNGCGYTNTPSIEIVGGGGTGATATAIVAYGEVVSIVLTDAGSGYTSTPAISVSSPLGAQIGLLQAVVPTFSDLSLGADYQLQASSDLINWTNQGPAFKATNTSMIFTQFYSIPDANQLYFRLQGAP